MRLPSLPITSFIHPSASPSQPASLLKDRLGRSLKDANVAADIWEILAGDQTQAEKSELLGGGGHQAAGLVGAEGNGAQAAAAG